MNAEVVVVGAGPAGAAAALTLADHGRSVVMIDQSQFPRDKPCGDALWSRAVKTLRELQIDGPLDSAAPIESTRVIRGFGGKPIERRFDRHSPKPLCIPRIELDENLVEAAIERGARFLLGRVENLKEQQGQVKAVVVRRADGTRIDVRAKAFVAADGVTSRMRRLLGLGHKTNAISAFAIRQYFRTELPVEPVFEVHMPVLSAGRWRSGYAWAFPVAERVINVGVGWASGVGTGFDKASLREGLNEFVGSFRVEASSRLGEIEGVDAPKGAPLAVHFSSDALSKSNVYFVGDAANLTDPLIGEGIAAALESGRMAGIEIERQIASGERHIPSIADVTRSFPRLGQDAGAVARNYCAFVENAGPGPSRSRGHPLLEDVLGAMMSGSDAVSRLHDSAVIRHLYEIDPTVGRLFAGLDDRAFEMFRTDLPLVTELLYRRFWSGTGPSAAATALIVESVLGGEVGSNSLAGALACELLPLVVGFLTQTDDEPTPGESNVGNGYAILIADFALTRWLANSLDAGPDETRRFAEAGRLLHEQAAAAHAAAWSLNRSDKEYFESAKLTSGATHAFAAGLGARRAGALNREKALTEFGRNYGVAMKIANDQLCLLDGDISTSRLPSDALRNGENTLLVIYALEEDPTLQKLVARATGEEISAEIVARIRRTSAAQRCVNASRSFVDAAIASIDGLDIEFVDRLSRFADTALVAAE
ncbi:MAG: geranylgeranyl reductase family protein [Actinobacteria bacterium]|nr:geranylgeranyl reductase family protein [Actinomycetota bacterium]